MLGGPLSVSGLAHGKVSTQDLCHQPFDHGGNRLAVGASGESQRHAMFEGRLGERLDVRAARGTGGHPPRRGRGRQA